MQLKDGTLLQGGKYEIVRFIASGGFGCTYEAKHTLLDECVAVKEFFVSDFCNRDDKTGQVTVATQSKVEIVGKLRKKFIDEARALFKMKHRGIVRVIDIFEENGTAYYAMEYIEGQSLGDMVKQRGKLPEAEAVGYIRQVAEALKYVHSLNRLHLDIKPGNIMLNKDGRAVLIDFGASKHYDAETGENTSTLLGINTKGYAPVEQVNRSFKSFSPATDIYALGATLYKLLTGITPPPSTELNAEEATLAPLPQSITASTRRAVEAAMQLLRKNRPQSVEDWLKSFGEAKEDDEETEIEVADVHFDCKKKHDEESTIIGDTAAKPFPNGLVPRWSADVTASQRAILEKLIANMVKVEGGTFTMGATRNDTIKKRVKKPMPWYKKIIGKDDEYEEVSFTEAFDNEKPGHQVTLSSFYIGRYQVTQAEWKALMGRNPSYFKGDNRPVERVSWYDCQDFVRKLNSLTGLRFKLPTEAQWEYAARGGRKSRGYNYSGSDDVGIVAWYDDNSGNETHPVGMKQANELGLYDMIGNVYEWCSDWYGAYSSGSQTNPTGAASGSGRIWRGGGYYDAAGDCRVSDRNGDTPDCREDNLGLRLVVAFE